MKNLLSTGREQDRWVCLESSRAPGPIALGSGQASASVLGSSAKAQFTYSNTFALKPSRVSRPAL
jgi:hypothetical protein